MQSSAHLALFTGLLCFLSSFLWFVSSHSRLLVDEQDLAGFSIETPKNNAVCLMGDSQGVDTQSLQYNVLSRMDADLFMILPTYAAQPLYLNLTTNISWVNDTDLEAFFNLLAPEWRLSVRGNYLGGLKGFSSSGAHQLRARWECERLISSYEQKHGHKYGYVGIGRADLLWLLPHPKVRPDGCWIPCQTNDWGGICDQWAWCERNNGRTYMLAPISDIPVNTTRKHLNTESHLMLSLEKHGVSVERGKAAFVRKCLSRSRKCVPINTLRRNLMNRHIPFESRVPDVLKHTYAKRSAGQREAAVIQVLESAIMFSKADNSTSEF